MKQVKYMAMVIAAILLLCGVFLNVAPAQGDAQPSDSAAFYKSKCVACHGQKAEKKFDPALTEEQQIEAILKGKKVEKPPHMPGSVG